MPFSMIIFPRGNSVFTIMYPSILFFFWKYFDVNGMLGEDKKCLGVVNNVIGGVLMLFTFEHLPEKMIDTHRSHDENHG